MMKVQEFPRSRINRDFRTHVTLGTFDGVHIGHRSILREVISSARDKGGTSAVVTFDRHPISVLRPDASPLILSTLDEKCSIFEAAGIDITFVLPFTRELADLSAGEFIAEYLIDRLNMETLIVGYDNGFGRKREGSPETFRELSGKLGFNLRIVEAVDHDGTTVKSSEIRSLLAKGNVEAASRLLGADYSLSGTVQKGWGIGRGMGIPTANIDPETIETMLPAPGIYAGWVEYGGGKYVAVANCGARPTFDSDEEVVEAHIIDFDGELYGEVIRLGFTRRLRDIGKFASRGELAGQIRKDIEFTKSLTIR